MRHIKLFFVAIIILIYSLPSTAQYDTISLRQNIQNALENYETKDSITMDPQLGEELKNNYFLGYKNLDYKNFSDENRAKELIQYYFTPDGIESIFRSWIIQSDTLDLIFPIGRFLFLNILLGAQDPENETNTEVEAEPMTKPNSQVNATVEPKQIDTARHKMGNIGNMRNNQPVERNERRGVSRYGAAEVKPKVNKIEVESQVATKPNYREEIVKMGPKKMLPTRTIDFERQRMMAITRLQNPVRPLINPNSQKQLKSLTWNTPNKYATLIINEPDKPEAEMYLDGKFIKELKKIKNGIKVQSNHHYEYEIKLENTVYCNDTITLGPKDKKTIKCQKP